MPDTVIRIDMADLGKRLDAMGPDRLPPTVASAVRWLMLKALRDVTIKQMSAPSPGPFPTLGVVTGAARRSVKAQPVETTPDLVSGSFGSPLVYVRAHEFGFSGRVQVRGHTRRLTTKSFRSGRLTKRASTELKEAIAEGRKTTAFVRPHSRHVMIRARRMFGRTMDELRPFIAPRIARSVEILVRTGKIPTLSEIGA